VASIVTGVAIKIQLLVADYKNNETFEPLLSSILCRIWDALQGRDRFRKVCWWAVD